MELAREVKISQGYAAKILAFLRAAGVARQGPDGYRVENPRQLLDAWAETRQFGEGETLRSYVVLGDAAQVERGFLAAARKLNGSYALTLFAGAARRARFVRSETVHAYWEGDPSSLVRELGAKASSEGGNLVLLEPYDEGVFHGVQDQEGARVVADVQLYVDLRSAGGRGREQAEFLLEKRMPDLAFTDSPETRARFLDALRVRDEADKSLRGGEYAEAVARYEELVGRLALLKAPGAESEFRRARLLLWTALVHVAEGALDRTAMEKARAIMTTDGEVEALRREVGYNAAHVELALVAYFAALARMSGDESERARYEEKARTHGTIVTSAFHESSGQIGQAAQAILSRIEKAGRTRG